MMAAILCRMGRLYHKNMLVSVRIFPFMCREHKMPPKKNAPASATHTASSDLWLFGTHAVRAAMNNPKRRIRRVLWAEKASLMPDFLAAAKNVKPEIVPREIMENFLPRGAVHQNIAALVAPLAGVNLEEFIAQCPARATVLVLDQITDPHNFGAILRSAAAFGVDAVMVTDRHAPPLGGTVAKAASGALERVPIMRVVNLARALAMLADSGFWRIGLAEKQGESLDHLVTKPPLMARVALVLGAEGSGMRRLTSEACDMLAHLPTQAEFSTLNVSNAAAIALYECYRRP